MNDTTRERNGSATDARSPHRKHSTRRRVERQGRNVFAEYRQHTPFTASADALAKLLPIMAISAPDGQEGPEAERAALLNLNFQTLAAMFDVNAHRAQTRDEREIAAFLADSLVYADDALPCGHVVTLPLTLNSPGRHVVMAWQCLTCGAAHLLDVRTSGAEGAADVAVRPLLHGSADAMLAALHERAGDAISHTMSGARYWVCPDDANATSAAPGQGRKGAA